MRPGRRRPARPSFPRAEQPFGNRTDLTPASAEEASVVSVSATRDYALKGQEQDLTLAPDSAARAGVGNALGNLIVGNALDNGLLGHSGNDALYGRLGNDTLGGGLGNDSLFGEDGDDRLAGNGGNDRLFGGEGDDVLFAGSPTTFSAIVSALTTKGDVEQWLASPGLSYMEAYVRFAPDLPHDVVFGIDQELFERSSKPIRYPGADWMALVGITRDGHLSVREGTAAELKGQPSRNGETSTPARPCCRTLGIECRWWSTSRSSST